MTIEVAASENLASNIETPSLDDRRATLAKTFTNLRSRLRDTKSPESARVVAKGWEQLMVAKELPRRLKLLSRYSGVGADSAVLVAFEHYLKFDISKPCYAMTIAWTRPEREGAVIDRLHFSVKENQSDNLYRFSASDSKTAYRSNGHLFPYSPGTPEALIPSKDLEAFIQSETLHWLMEKEIFSLGVLEELTGLFE